MSGPNDFILDGLRWSFSSVNSYHTCPQAFRLGYLDALPRVDNAFSDWGSFMHSLLERYFKGELEFFELSQAYQAGYAAAVKCKFPPNRFVDLTERYYAAGKSYLDSFDGSAFEGCEIIGVEQKVKLTIHGRPFVGVIDLLLQKGEDYTICDHKSKSAFKSQKERDEYARQLYLYAVFVHEKFGKWPVKLVFHMVRSGGELVKIPFDEEACEAAQDWFSDTIDAIYQDTVFESTPNRIRRELKELRAKQESGKLGFSEYTKQKKKLEAALKKEAFMCHVLCGSRENCPDCDKAPPEE